METDATEFVTDMEQRVSRLDGKAKRTAFRKSVRDFYTKFGRAFPWRETTDPYRILLSELMLQQTQTERVLSKYLNFLQALPTIQAVSIASTHEVLGLWSGLGYYRRALNLKRAAIEIVEKHHGYFPRSFDSLESLPGIGPYSAGAICNFAFNVPTAMIETNIRAVYLHFFFSGQSAVPDKDILSIVVETMDRVNPREWFYALMDLGVAIKKVRPKVNHRSKHHVKQSKFKGSHREKRASVLRVLQGDISHSVSGIARMLSLDEEYAKGLLNELHEEGFLDRKRTRYQLRRE